MKKYTLTSFVETQMPFREYPWALLAEEAKKAPPP